MIMELIMKNWPVNMWIQTPMDLIDKLYRKYQFNPDDIERMEVSPYIPERSEDAPAEAYESLVRAQFSIPFCMAMYLKGPKVGYDWLDAKYLSDPEILKLAGKVHGVGEISTIPQNFTMFQQGSYPTYGMKIVMKDGTVYEESMQFPKGHPKNDYTRQECIDVFKLATSDLMSEEKQDALCEFIFNLDKVEDMGEIAKYITL